MRYFPKVDKRVDRSFLCGHDILLRNPDKLLDTRLSRPPGRDNGLLIHGDKDSNSDTGYATLSCLGSMSDYDTMVEFWSIYSRILSTANPKPTVQEGFNFRQKALRGLLSHWDWTTLMSTQAASYAVRERILQRRIWLIAHYSPLFKDQVFVTPYLECFLPDKGAFVLTHPLELSHFGMALSYTPPQWAEQPLQNRSDQFRADSDLHFPVIPCSEYSSFDDYFGKKCRFKTNRRSLLEGAMSKKVGWSYFKSREVHSGLMRRLKELAMLHFDSLPDEAKDPLTPTRWDEYERDLDGSDVMVATDLSENKVVAFQAIDYDGKAANLGSCGKVLDDKYKSFSLIPMGILAATRHVFSLPKEERPLFINLGLNFHETPYKNDIGHSRIPLLNFPMWPVLLDEPSAVARFILTEIRGRAGTKKEMAEAI